MLLFAKEALHPYSAIYMWDAVLLEGMFYMHAEGLNGFKQLQEPWEAPAGMQRNRLSPTTGCTFCTHITQIKVCKSGARNVGRTCGPRYRYPY